MGIEQSGDVGRIACMKSAGLPDQRTGSRIGHRAGQHRLQQFPLDGQAVFGESASGQVSHVRFSRHGEVNIGGGTEAVAQAGCRPFKAGEVGAQSDRGDRGDRRRFGLGLSGCLR